MVSVCADKALELHPTCPWPPSPTPPTPLFQEGCSGLYSLKPGTLLPRTWSHVARGSGASGRAKADCSFRRRGRVLRAARSGLRGTPRRGGAGTRGDGAGGARGVCAHGQGHLVGGPPWKLGPSPAQRVSLIQEVVPLTSGAGRSWSETSKM